VAGAASQEAADGWVMRFIDLFAGLGGFHQAAHRLGGKCAFASEIDADLRALYKKNFNLEPAGDIREVPLKDIPAHDLLCAGFPCQPFSKAGAQRGWKDAIRGTLFDNIVKILAARKPEFVVLENVAHFIEHDEGNTYQKVEEALKAVGYEIEHRVLSPHEFGVPQIRQRMYLVGRLAAKGSLAGFNWPTATTTKDDLALTDYLDKNPPEAEPLSDRIISCLNAWQEFMEFLPKKENISGFPIWSMEFGARYPYTKFDSLHDAPLPVLRRSRGSFGQSLDSWRREELLTRVPSHARWEDDCFPGWKQNFIRKNRALYLRNKKWIDKWVPKVRGFASSLQKLEWHGDERDIWAHVIQFRASGVRVKRPTTAPALVAMTTSQVPIIGWERRYITPKECARLQSMGDLKNLPARSIAFKAFGNAVNVDVAALVIKSLLDLRGAKVVSSKHLPPSQSARQAALA